MKSKTKEQTSSRLLITSAVVVVLVLTIGTAFIYLPFTHKNKSLRADILKERDKNLLVGKIKALNKYIKIYNKRIPDAGNVSWLLSEISNMASKERIEISSIKPEKEVDYGLYAKLSVVVDMASTYNQFGRFIAGIESSEKFLKVESVNMKRMDLDERFKEGSGKFKAFDIKANIVISTIISKE